MQETLWILAACTWGMRLVGPVFANRFALTDRQQKLLSEVAVVLLCALAVTSMLFDGAHFGGWAKVFGVLVALSLLIFKSPFPVVVIAAAGVTAGLRYLGVA